MDFDITVTSKSGDVFSGKCSSLSLPLDDGSYCILAHHAPSVFALAKGILEFESEDKKYSYSISDGITVFDGEKARVLVSACKNLNNKEKDMH